MKLNIGETIKKLRKEREITQEEFAEVLGVSCQSVSRWENNSCYPDIELIPTIAAFFDISTDKLMGIDQAAETKAVDQYLKDFQAAISIGNIDECVRIARSGVAQFPNNYTLLNKLMYALFVTTSDDADIVDWKENRQKYDAEIVALGERIVKYCSDAKIKLEATNRLAFHHSEMGRKDIALSIYDTLPSITDGKEWNIWWSLTNEEKLPHTRKFILDSYYALDESLWRLTDLIPAEDALKVFEKISILDNLIYDDSLHNQTWSNARYYCFYAKCLVQLNRFDEAIKQLELSVESAIAFDNRPEEIKINSLLLGEKVRKRTDFETADSRPFCERVRDVWLAEKEFDVIRDTEEFKGILEQLK
ncbi:MAG: helix-turn-helix transcriptional regulator [Clostridia bacterium]|nr:helix-turn-helix transcriptional regulator [Clostridia bacterium]